jgi:succinoglycan biosynthesis protein ExoA
VADVTPISTPAARHAVLVVIPALNEALHIEAVLLQLTLGIPQGLRVRFVVCDGGSHDGTQAIVNHLSHADNRISLLHNPMRLQSAAVNLAVRAQGSGFDVLVRCDAHSTYPAGYVLSLLQSLERTQAHAIVVPMDSIGDSCLRKAVAWVSDTPVGSGGSAHRGGGTSGFVDHGHHAAFRMATFISAGGYDETFSHNEDAELDCRQRALGARIFLDTTIRIGYLPRGTWGGLWRQYRGYGRGRSRTVRRHPQSLRLRQFAVPANFAICALCLALVPRWAGSGLWPAAYLAVLSAAGGLLAMKHRSACGLLAAPVAALMHTAWAVGFLQGMVVHREARWNVAAAQPLALAGESDGRPVNQGGAQISS